MKLIDIIVEELEDRQKEDFLTKQRRKVRNIHSAIKRGTVNIGTTTFNYVLSNNYNVNVEYRKSGQVETIVRFEEEYLTPRYKDRILKLYKVNPDGEDEYVPYGQQIKFDDQKRVKERFGTTIYEAAWKKIMDTFKKFGIRVYPEDVAQLPSDVDYSRYRKID
jgi:hypothetical protein